MLQGSGDSATAGDEMLMMLPPTTIRSAAMIGAIQTEVKFRRRHAPRC